MAKIIPIKGIRFSSKANLDFSRLITPPYDVITPEMQEEFYRKSPFNVIRLEYPREMAGDDHFNNKYTRAAATMEKWLEKGILQQEEKPAIYLYEQKFAIRNRSYVRQSLFCGIKLTPFGEGDVVPHEETMSKPKADRLKLLRHCEANFSPIFGLYKNESLFLESLFKKHKEIRKPEISFFDEEGQEHLLWCIQEESLIREITGFFQDKKIFIADGHHRYETALEFYLEKKKEKGEGAEPYGYTLIALVNIYDEGLLVFPTHRLITRSKTGTSELLEKISGYFAIQELPEPQSKDELISLLDKNLTGATKRNITLGLYAPESKFYLLTLKKMEKEKELYPWLDTVILQELIFVKVFGLGEKERKNENHLIYLKDEWEAKVKVDLGQANFAFYVNKPPLEDIIRYAEEGIRMPQKSTFFYPKFVSGLIMFKPGAE